MLLELLTVSRRYHRVLAALLVLAVLLAPAAGAAAAQPAGHQAETPAPGAQDPVDPAAAVDSHTDEAHAEEEHGSGWLQVVAKVFNFALLAGVITYFAKAPIAEYLKTRGETIRRDLVEARTLRQSAESQLRSVQDRLAQLPGELEALTARGKEELAHEQVRLRETTVQEREKLLVRTRREIELQARVARRDLVAHTADLAMGLARRRIEQAITPDDQARLIDRYAQEVRS